MRRIAPFQVGSVVLFAALIGCFFLPFFTGAVRLDPTDLSGWALASGDGRGETSDVGKIVRAAQPVALAALALGAIGLVLSFIPGTRCLAARIAVSVAGFFAIVVLVLPAYLPLSDADHRYGVWFVLGLFFASVALGAYALSSRVRIDSPREEAL